ncbi:MAG: hypothetical protein H7123_08490 [Thermoleophilia bacterium]|nr:hypothetical protein [Thermoleophilia bacterium]
MTSTSLIAIVAFLTTGVLSVCFLRALCLAGAARREYERASRDYRALVDHRLANPLATILGAAETLLADSLLLNASKQYMLLLLIRDEAQRVAHTSLSPRVLSTEELTLDPLPNSRSMQVA